MTFEIILFPEVLLDLEENFYWYEEQSDGLGYGLEAEFYAHLNDVGANPLGFQIRYGKSRITWLDRFPYGIHFYVEGDTIFVSALIHTSRSPKRWGDRLNP